MALRDAKLLVVCGTGGVGKTSISASLAIKEARKGRKVCLITIDPAKRLAHTLGLEALGDEPHELTSEIQPTQGSLHALMPDTHRTLERFIEQVSPTPKAAERVYANPVFQVFAREFSGTNEYMALQKVLSLSESGRFDLIVLDTPPSQDTIDFLEAPGLLARMFDEKLVHIIALPTHRFFAAGVRKALSVLESLTGAGFMTHFFDFARSLYELRHKFSGRLADASRLLRSPTTRFVLVSSPRADLKRETKHFVDQVESKGFGFDGLILNRSLRHLSFPDKSLDPAVELYRLHKIAQDRYVSEVLGGLRMAPLLAEVPELANDLHSIGDLSHVASHLESL